MTQPWPWYQVLTSSTDLAQGDILDGVVVPEISPGSREVDERKYTLIVMTQSCDIPDIPQFIFCPVWTREQLGAIEPKFNDRSYIGNLTSGRVVGFLPIDKSTEPGMERPWRIVQFERIIELKREDLYKQLAEMGPRLRVLPPYREHIAQQFARFFMRVGLPVPVDTS